MDGKKYLEMKSLASSAVEREAQPSRNPQTVGDAVACTNDTYLFEQLDLLYGKQEVHFLTDPTSTVSYDKAVQNIELQRLAVEVYNRRARHARPSKYDLSSKTHGRRAEDNSDALSPDEVMEQLKGEFSAERSMLADVSSLVISTAIRDLYHQGDAIKKGKASVSGVVNGAVNANRSILLDALSGTLRLDVTAVRGSDEVEVKSKGATALESGLKWLDKSSKWNEQLSLRAAQGLLELDTYSALMMWCMDRKLGALVIPAPSFIERGFALPNGQNANADLLVISMEDNQIAPVQVKNSNNSTNYIDDMVMASPSRMSLVDPITQIRRVNGWAKTVQAHTTHYGAFSALLQARLKNKDRRDQFVDEKKRLDKAFAFFDYKVLPQLTKK